MTLLQWLFLIVLALLVYSYVVYPLIAAIIGVGPVASVHEELPRGQHSGTGAQRGNGDRGQDRKFSGARLSVRTRSNW